VFVRKRTTTTGGEKDNQSHQNPTLQGLNWKGRKQANGKKNLQRGLKTSEGPWLKDLTGNQYWNLKRMNHQYPDQSERLKGETGGKFLWVEFVHSNPQKTRQQQVKEQKKRSRIPDRGHAKATQDQPKNKN